MKIFYLLTLSFIVGCAQKKAEDTITLISEGYQGPVVIVLNQKGGQEKVYEGEKRIYKIPENGVLQTQFQEEYGLQSNKFYYVSKEGNRSEIKWLNISEEVNSGNANKTICIFNEEHLSKAGGVDAEGEFSTAPMIAFYVGVFSEIEKKMNEQMKFVFKNQMKEKN
jgi:hypothetical protein